MVMRTRNARKKLSPRSSIQKGNRGASAGFDTAFFPRSRMVSNKLPSQRPEEGEKVQPSVFVSLRSGVFCFMPPGANSNRYGLSFVGQLWLFQVRGLFRRRYPSA
jgi:hypothetical protein